MNGLYEFVPGGTRGVSTWRRCRGVAIALAGLMVAGSAVADVPAPAAAVEPSAHQADSPDTYRTVGAQHLYDLYRDRIFKGPLPPLLYAIAITETEIDEDGNVLNTVVTREPASAKDVMPWIVGLIRAASPFPKPARGGTTRYQDIWLVDRTYLFQLHTLTAGQRWNE